MEIIVLVFLFILYLSINIALPFILTFYFSIFEWKLLSVKDLNNRINFGLSF
jgi:hypothetical protein